MRLTKTQREFRKKTKKLVRDRKVKDRYGQVIKPESIWDKQININWKKIFGMVWCTLTILYLLQRTGLLSMIVKTSGLDNKIETTNLNNITVGSQQKIVNNYLQYVKIFDEYIKESNTIYNKYRNNDIYTKSEIIELYEKIENIKPDLENAPDKAGGLKQNSITLADSTLTMLNLLNKELETTDKTYREDINQQIAIRNSCINQEMDLKIEIFENYNMKYKRNDNGDVIYFYQE